MHNKEQNRDSLRKAYREMAEDSTREREACEWCEALFSDAFNLDQQDGNKLRAGGRLPSAYISKKVRKPRHH